MAHWRTRLVDRWMDFKPHVQDLPVGDPALRFFHATSQSVDWYEPLGAHLLAELQWVQQHLRGRIENIVDAGAFHGLYAMVMANAAAAGSRVVAVDPVKSNCAVTEVNFALNGLTIKIENAAVSLRDEPQRFTTESCGRLSDKGALTVDGKTLPSIMADATVVKMDIEGAEFSVLPAQIDQMSKVHTWIVEIHPGYGSDPDIILELFRSRNFELLYLDRASAQVVPLSESGTWDDRTSLIALKR